MNKVKIKPNQSINFKLHQINAEGKIFGRLCTETANLIRGKHKARFNYRENCGDKVNIYNINHVRFTGRKLEEKKYYHHTQYLGGLKEIKLKDLFQKKPDLVFKKAVYNMLPKNRLRKLWMNNLSVCLGEKNE